MADIAPNFAGFMAAQVNLAAQFGEDVEFKTASAGAWPSGAAIDPETLRPFDPTIAALGSGMVSTTRSVQIVTGALRLDSELENTPGGHRPSRDVVLILSEDDYAEVSGADEAEWLDQRYLITEFRPDHFAGHKRWLAYLEKM